MLCGIPTGAQPKMKYQIEIEGMDAWFLHGFLSGWVEKSKLITPNHPVIKMVERIIKDMEKSMGNEAGK